MWSPHRLRIPLDPLPSLPPPCSYLDTWDTQLSNFDNSDDYPLERRRVRAAKGASYRFSYTDYAVKILLGSLMRKYFAQDQATLLGGSGCCGCVVT